MTLSGALAISVDWNDDLNDSSSFLYQSTEAIAKSELETLLKSSDDVQDATVTVTGFEEVTSSRIRRQATSSKATVNYSAECTVPESKSMDDISSSVETAVTTADPRQFRFFNSFAGFGVNVKQAAKDKNSATTPPTITGSSMSPPDTIAVVKPFSLTTAADESMITNSLTTETDDSSVVIDVTTPTDLVVDLTTGDIDVTGNACFIIYYV